jgi:hypothetical protein
MDMDTAHTTIVIHAIHVVKEKVSGNVSWDINLI